MSTLTAGSTVLQLPSGLHWVDEFAWSPIAESAVYGLTGSLILQTGVRTNGRPITLEADEDRAWMPRATLEQLYALASAPGQTMTLTLRGVDYTVRWRHHDGAPIEARPLLPGAPITTPTGGTYITKLRFVTV